MSSISTGVSLAVLPSQIGQCCPTMKNLTIVDLEECKWSMRKNVFRSLLENNPKLVEYHNTLEDLIDKRNSEVTVQKQRNVDRETIMQHEHIFRSSFMNIILDTLAFMHWPPANEAFTDHLGQLLSDKMVVINAIGFLVSRNPTLDIHSREARSAGKVSGMLSGSTPSTPRTPRKSPPDRGIGNSSYSSRNNRPSSDRGMLKQGASYDEYTSNSYISDVSASASASVSMSNPVDITDPSGYTPSNCYNHYNGGQDQNQGNDQDRREPLTRQTPGRSSHSVKYSDALDTIEVLQKQNEMLQQRVLTLQRSFNTRTDSEAKLERVLSEVIDVVNSLCVDKDNMADGGSDSLFSGLSFNYSADGVGMDNSGVSAKGGSSKKNGNGSGETTTNINSYPASSKSSGTHASNTQTANNSSSMGGGYGSTSDKKTSSGKGIVWRQVSSKLTKLKGQWIEARKEVQHGGAPSSDDCHGSVNNSRSSQSFDGDGLGLGASMGLDIKTLHLVHANAIDLSISAQSVLSALYRHDNSASSGDRTTDDMSSLKIPPPTPPRSLYPSPSDPPITPTFPPTDSGKCNNILTTYSNDENIIYLQRSMVSLLAKSDTFLLNMAHMIPLATVTSMTMPMTSDSSECDSQKYQPYGSYYNLKKHAKGKTVPSVTKSDQSPYSSGEAIGCCGRGLELLVDEVLLFCM